MGKFLLVVLVFAAAVYFAFWLLERHRAPAGPRARAARPVPRTVAPDDDEEFLRDLNRRNRGDQDKDKPGE